MNYLGLQHYMVRLISILYTFNCYRVHIDIVLWYLIMHRFHFIFFQKRCQTRKKLYKLLKKHCKWYTYYYNFK